MGLDFPNISRNYDTTRGCVRFSGYDRTREIAFYIEEDALRSIDGGNLANAQALLLAFDRHRDRICNAAVRAYARKSEGSYTLTPEDV